MTTRTLELHKMISIKKQQHQKAEVVEITPAEAQRHLNNNRNNRKPRMTVVERYARDMRAGNWSITGESIAIDENGDLLNGQHRLMACVRAGVPFTTVLVTGVPPSAFRNMDTGAKRTIGDMLMLMGHKDHNARAAVLTFVWRWERESLRDTVRPTHAEAVQYLEDNPTMFNGWMYRQGYLRTTAVNSFNWMVRKHAPNTAGLLAEFWEPISSGFGMTAGDPRIALEKWMRNRHTHRHGSSDPVTTTVEAALIVKTWNKWILNVPVQRVQFKPREEFPGILDINGHVAVRPF